MLKTDADSMHDHVPQIPSWFKGPPEQIALSWNRVRLQKRMNLLAHRWNSPRRNPGVSAVNGLTRTTGLCSAPVIV